MKYLVSAMYEVNRPSYDYKFELLRCIEGSWYDIVFDLALKRYYRELYQKYGQSVTYRLGVLSLEYIRNHIDVTDILNIGNYNEFLDRVLYFVNIANIMVPRSDWPLYDYCFEVVIEYNPPYPRGMSIDIIYLSDRSSYPGVIEIVVEFPSSYELDVGDYSVPEIGPGPSYSIPFYLSVKKVKDLRRYSLKTLSEKLEEVLVRIYK